MRVAKILAVIAAVLLVGSVALATLGPPEMSLGDAITWMDQKSLAKIGAFIRTNPSAWLWRGPVMAVIERPIWLLPAALGLICAGGAATAASVPATNKSHRRRS